jgi:hypothetical protein
MSIEGEIEGWQGAGASLSGWRREAVEEGHECWPNVELKATIC